MDRESLVEAITAIIADPAGNSLGPGAQEPAFGRPLIGFSRGDDPLYPFLKKDIGDFYLLPAEIFAASFPEERADARELTVICWILPQTEETKRDHRRQKKFPAERWTRARLFGERFNEHVRSSVVDLLQRQGHPAVAPVLSPVWNRHMSAAYGFASSWSERHTAFVCGLGTFGLSDGLITPAGKAVRIGSVIAAIDIEPSPRPYLSHTSNCLYYSTGKCMKCAQRCPAGAISAAGHDKERCKKYIREVANRFAEEHYGLRTNSCGLCQTGVPCESKIPVRHTDGEKQ